LGYGRLGLPASLRQHSIRASARQAPGPSSKAPWEVFFPPTQLGGRAIDPFFNINRPEDLAEANALLAAG
jgi:molybdopterin-guanine dinucleotide biosynthesis protein A